MKVSLFVIIRCDYQPHEAGSLVVPVPCSQAAPALPYTPFYALDEPECIHSEMETPEHLPEIVLFGASMIEWSFKEKTHGLGWFLSNRYEGKAQVLNEGTRRTITTCNLRYTEY